jgi:hypothetical protein
MNGLDRFKSCPSCGTENPPAAADCVKCGADILAEPVERRAAGSAPATAVAPTDECKPHVRLESLYDPANAFVVFDGQTVGRSDASDVVIDGVPDLDSISRRMALFFRRGQQWYVQHIAGTNFVAVDGEEYESDDEIAIRDGSVVGLALCQFFVRIPQTQ